LLHNRQNIAVDKNEIFRIFTVVTLRQVLTKITGKVHNSSGGQDRLDHRKQVESIVVNAVMNIIEQQINKEKNRQKSPLFEQVYEELLTELLKSLTDQHHSV